MKNTKIYTTGITEAKKINKASTKMTMPGSLKHWLWGSEKSEQSMVIKFGRVFEKMIQEEVRSSTRFKLGTNGVQKITGQKRKKDIDLLFIDDSAKIIYYRELKANIDLDTEKLPATIDKIKLIEEHLQTKYPSYSIDFGILCMSVYSKSLLENRLAKKVETYENSNVPVDFASDIFTILGINVSSGEYEAFGQELGHILRS